MNFADPLGLFECDKDHPADCARSHPTHALGSGCPAISDTCNVDPSTTGPRAAGAAIAAAAVVAGVEALGAASEDIPVIGRLPDTQQFIGKKGFEVLNLSENEWTFEKNMKWIDNIIEQRRSVLTATDQTADNLWNANRQVWSVYKAELEQFFKAGYRQVLDHLVPPPQ